MSRDNFFVKLRGIDQQAVYVHLDNIASVEEKLVKSKDLPATAVSVITLVSGDKLEVQESMVVIMAKAAAYGVAKVME